MLKMYDLHRALPSSSEEPAVPIIKHPIVYKVSKGEQTHYLVGTMGRASLSNFPRQCIDIFEQCQSLLIETWTTISMQTMEENNLISDSLQDNDLIDRLRNTYKGPFRDDMVFYANYYGLECAIESISPRVLYMLWQANKDQALDRDFVNFAREMKMQIISVTSFEMMLNAMKKPLSEPMTSYESEEATHQISRHYALPNKIHPTLELRLDRYLNEKIEGPGVSKQDLVNLNAYEYIHKWMNTFMDAHHQGKDKILMLLGYECLFCEGGIMSLLETQKFKIERYHPEFGFSQELVSEPSSSFMI